MQICGLNKTTLLDYPEHVAATIFLGGCNFRCPFCHNGDLVLHPNMLPSISEEEINSFLKNRRHILTGVCITGGEPTIHKELPDFIRHIKKLDFLVKLDTNGSNPSVIQSLLAEKLLDYIAMDIKGDKEHYGIIAGFPQASHKTPLGFDLSPIQASIDLIVESNIAYEFRTTVIKEFHNVDSFKKIGEWLHGSDKYFLQNYQESPHMIQNGFHGYEKEQLSAFSQILSPHFHQVGIRGV